MAVYNLEQSHGNPRRFDRHADPEESTNVAARHPEVIARQIRRLEATIGMPLPAVYQYQPSRGVSATDSG